VLEVSGAVHTMMMRDSMFKLQSSTVSPLAREITLCLHGQVSRLPIVDAKHHPVNKQNGVRLTTVATTAIPAVTVAKRTTVHL